MPGVVFSIGMGHINDGQLEPLAASVQVAYNNLLASCIPVLRAAAWCCCCHGNRAVGTQPISSFSNAVNSQLNADASSEKIIYDGPVLMKFYQPVLRVRFYRASYASTVLAVIVCLSVRPSVCHKSEIYKDG